MKKHYTSNSQLETEELGMKLAERLKKGDMISISGALGAGKTAFARGILLGFGVKSGVSSPTFSIVNEYRLCDELTAAHFDLYRVEDEETLAAAGYYDYLGSAIVIVEWGEKTPRESEINVVNVQIEGSGDERRRITVERGDER